MKTYLQAMIGHPLGEIRVERVYGDNLSAIQFANSDGSAYTVKTREMLFQEYETFTISLDLTKVPNILDDVIDINGTIESIELVRRAEWLSSASKHRKIIGKNAKVQRWSKIDEVPNDIKEVNIVDCGIVIYLVGAKRMLIYISDYPDTIAISEIDTQIDEYRNQFSVISI